MAPGLPACIGKYQVLKLLSKGGMGEVFLGRQLGEGGFERFVAIKRTRADVAAKDAKFVRMFVDEARISAQLSHGCIAQTIEFGRDGASHFIAFEYVDGLDLRAILLRAGQPSEQLPPPLCAYIVSRAAAGLAYAHNRTNRDGMPLHIVHRDVSPANIMVSFDGEVKVIDFGVAKAEERLSKTTGLTLKGKYAYMSPEQALAQPIDHRADIFSLGVVFYELLTSHNPFRDINASATVGRVLSTPPTPPRGIRDDVPAELDTLCLRALCRAPDDRFATVSELQAGLEHYLRSSPYAEQDLRAWMRSTFADELTQSRRQLGGTDSEDLRATMPEALAPPIKSASVRDALARGVRALTNLDALLGRRDSLAEEDTTPRTPHRERRPPRVRRRPSTRRQVISPAQPMAAVVCAAPTASEEQPTPAGTDKKPRNVQPLLLVVFLALLALVVGSVGLYAVVAQRPDDRVSPAVRPRSRGPAQPVASDRPSNRAMTASTSGTTATPREGTRAPPGEVRGVDAGSPEPGMLNPRRPSIDKDRGSRAERRARRSGKRRNGHQRRTKAAGRPSAVEQGESDKPRIDRLLDPMFDAL